MSTPAVDFDRDAFLADRREMLLALDVGKMRAYAARWGARVSADDEVCLASMPMARLDAPEIPKAERAYSRHWLTQNGYKAGRGK